MRYLSVCSGIEAASVAWEPLGWTPVAFSEIEKFPSKVLAHRFPNVPNLGDMTRYKEWDIARGSIDLLVGGTPCQAFSVAGLRKGLDDPRGNLALTFIAMVEHFKPEWVVWENVPGVLSSSGGRDFGSFVGALGNIGYGWAYRVLDAQYFGVPQRRRRVFVVAHSSGDSRRAAEVLFEPESLSRNNHQGKQTRENTAATSITGTVSSKWAKGTGGPAGDECYNLINTSYLYENHPNDSRVTGPVDPSPTVTSRWGTGGNNTPLVQHTYRKSRRAQSQQDFETWISDDVTNTLNCFDVGDVRSVDIVIEQPAHAFNIRGLGHYTGANGGVVKPGTGGSGYMGQDEKAYTISTSQDQQIMAKMAVRRLTPTECERLQGFPDGWTDIAHYRCCGSTFDFLLGKYGCSNCEGNKSAFIVETADSSRYKALGNSMAVPVMRWIGGRINEHR
jgi:DNA (cytosine-5)-methyltransferase 1